MFLKQLVPDTKYILFDISETQLDFVKSVFKDKYLINDSDLDNIISVNKYTDLYSLKIQNVLIVDVNTYDYIKVFINNAKHIFMYSNEEHKFLNSKNNLTCYGWYEQYQMFNKKTRFKLFKEIHRTYENDEKEYVYLTSPLGNYDNIIDKLKLSKNNLIVKTKMDHTFNLFKKVKKIVYYHTGFLLKDTNNRMIVEAGIHNTDIDVHLNGYYIDSIHDRYTLLKENRLNELYLTKEDILINDFVTSCKGN